MRVRRPGAVLLRVHWTPYWALAGTSGCVARRGPWTVLLARRPGSYLLSARFSVGRLLDPDAVCERAPSGHAKRTMLTAPTRRQ